MERFQKVMKGSWIILSAKTMNKSLLLLIGITLLLGCEKFDDYGYLPDDQLETTNLVTKNKATEIAEVVCNTLNNNDLIGLQVSITDSLGEQWNLAMGSINVKQTNPLEKFHILRIGSVTKMYTASLILKLVEYNTIQMEQNLSDFFPGFKNAKDIQIVHLLNHSSGISDVFSMPDIFISSTNFPDKKWNPNRLAETCLEKKLDFQPGTKSEYSNTNFILLGLIAEKATGKKIPQLFYEHLFQPLKLDDTYLVPFEDYPANLVNGYVHHYALSLKEWYVNEPGNTSWSTIAFTAGAMVSTASELSKFTYHVFNGDVINDESLTKMTSFSSDKGLGLFKIEVNNSIYWGHEGEITGFEAITAYNPENRMIISITCNTTPFHIYDLLDSIDQIVN